MPEDRLPVAVVETLGRAVVAVLVPYGGAGVIVYDAIRGRLAARMQQTAEEILADVGPDVLAARLAESSEFEALVINALDSAARTGYEAKRRLMARVVVNAALDEAAVDESVLVEQAVGDLEGPHFRALARLSAAWDARGVTVEDREVTTLLSEDDRGGNVKVRVIAEASSKEPPSVIAALVRVGALETASAYGGAIGVSGITDFGRAILAELGV